MEYTLEQQLQDALDALARTSRLLDIFQQRIARAIRLCSSKADTANDALLLATIEEVLRGSSEHTPPAAP